MCVICVKEKGQEFPSKDKFKDMWTSNPDGSGFMYNHLGKVFIQKGFMKWNDFWDTFEETKKYLEEEAKINVVEDTAWVFHFRIATHGGVCQSLTHPFPLTNKAEDILSTECITDIGVAHNGIIPTIVVTPRKGFSDTAEYVAGNLYNRYMYHGDFYKKEKTLKKIGKQTSSRVCFLDGLGDVYYAGDWTKDGVWNVSNKLYDFGDWYKYSHSRAINRWNGWDYDYCDGYDYNYNYTQNTKSKTETNPEVLESDDAFYAGYEQGYEDAQYELEYGESITSYNMAAYNKGVASSYKEPEEYEIAYKDPRIEQEKVCFTYETASKRVEAIGLFLIHHSELSYNDISYCITMQEASNSAPVSDKGKDKQELKLIKNDEEGSVSVNRTEEGREVVLVNA